MYHCDRFARSAWLHIAHPTAERKIRNVDFVIAQNRAYFSNHAGHVAVAKLNQVTFQWSLHFDSVHVQ